MKAAMIQRAITVLEDVITGIHEKKTEVRLWRKEWNGEIDRIVAEKPDDVVHREWIDEQVGKASKYIRKSRKKLKELEEVQRALKVELKGAQAIEMWQAQEDTEWRHLPKLAQQEEYKVTYSYDELGELMFKED